MTPTALIKELKLNKVNEIAKNLGSYSRRVKGCILNVFGLWRNAEDGLKDE